MNNIGKNIKGFALFEFFMSLIVIAVISGIAVPIIMYVVKIAQINAFKNDAYNALEAVKIYVATTNFDSIPDEGIEISKLNIELKNNNFDGGIVKKVGNDKFEIINLRRANYCASGTTDSMKATDKGCGALDKTSPENPHVFIKSIDGNNLTVTASATDNESNIIGYEFSIDNSKYTKKSRSNEYTFKNIKGNIHNIKVKVTNEAGKIAISENKKLNTNLYKNINCYEKNSLELYQPLKNVICEYPHGSNYVYEYSNDNKTWNSIDVKDNLYKFNVKDNETIYTRVISNKKVISFNSIKISNIDRTLNGAYPELLDNMIPVVYDDNKKEWIKADSRLKYFDYANKQWANAVFVRRVKDTDDPLSNNREYYLSNDAIGQVVYSKDIVAHYVWIPRFKYKLFNLTSVQKEPNLIDILFENKEIEPTISNKVGEFITHNAFMYNDGVNGFWVSKYKTSVSNTSSCYNDINECNKSDLILYAKDSDKKLTNISISNAHLNTKNMTQVNNIYGLSKNASAHVLTNLEYGSILYLTNSIYGINNNNYEYSTTGNMSGLFDLKSNNPEMVMGNFNKDPGKSTSNSSGFKDYGSVDWPDYIDYYEGITSKNRILGDATGETNGWYDSYSKFVNGEEPFFIRGGVIENKASIYNYSSFSGNKNELYTFRTVLTK